MSLSLEFSLALPTTVPSITHTGAKPQAPKHLVASNENKPSGLVPLIGEPVNFEYRQLKLDYL